MTEGIKAYLTGKKIWPSRSEKERGTLEEAATNQQETQNPNSGANTSGDITSCLENNYSFTRVNGDSTRPRQLNEEVYPLTEALLVGAPRFHCCHNNTDTV